MAPNSLCHRSRLIVNEQEDVKLLIQEGEAFFMLSTRNNQIYGLKISKLVTKLIQNHKTFKDSSIQKKRKKLTEKIPTRC